MLGDSLGHFWLFLLILVVQVCREFSLCSINILLPLFLFSETHDLPKENHRTVQLKAKSRRSSKQGKAYTLLMRPTRPSFAASRITD